MVHAAVTEARAHTPLILHELEWLLGERLLQPGDAVHGAGGGGRGSGGTGGGEGRLSQHPTDRMIRTLIHTKRQVRPEEIEQIVDRMATVPMPTIAQHFVNRLGEAQWGSLATEADYLQHLRLAIREPSSRLIVYERRGGGIAGILADTERIVPARLRGEDWRPLLYVVYSADRGILLSGYQATNVSRISIPENALWLK